VAATEAMGVATEVTVAVATRFAAS
jgi:hypothetical protein